MRGHFSFLLSASLLLSATASTGQTLSCSSVSPEVREYVKQRGACRDTKPPAPRAKASPRAETSPRPAASPRNDAKASDTPVSAPQKLAVPKLVGRSYADAVRELKQFSIEAVDTASAKPAGTVLAQEPAPGALAAPGTIISLQVSDGSPVKPASTAAIAPVTAAAAPAPPSNLASASPPAPSPIQEAATPPAARGQSSTLITANGALIFVIGVSLGLLFGALWMRQWLLHPKPAATVIGFAPKLSSQPHPVVQPWVDPPLQGRTLAEQPLEDGESVDQPSETRESVEQPSEDGESVEQPLQVRESVDQQPQAAESVDQQPLSEQPAEVAAENNLEADATPEIRFAAWLVPVETTIEMIARADELSSETSSDHYA